MSRRKKQVAEPTTEERLYERLHFLYQNTKAFSDSIPAGVSPDEKVTLKGQLIETQKLLVELDPENVED